MAFIYPIRLLIIRYRGGIYKDNLSILLIMNKAGQPALTTYIFGGRVDWRIWRFCAFKAFGE